MGAREQCIVLRVHLPHAPALSFFCSGCSIGHTFATVTSKDAEKLNVETRSIPGTISAAMLSTICLSSFGRFAMVISIVGGCGIRTTTEDFYTSA